jgi:hypothetical protein
VTDRPAHVVLTEVAPHLAYLATEALYEARPELWDRGEKGRFHTLDDFTMHFRAVAEGEAEFRTHVDYCHRLFAERGFPRDWLDDAWRFMRLIADRELEGDAHDAFVTRLETVTRDADS